MKGDRIEIEDDVAKRWNVKLTFQSYLDVVYEFLVYFISKKLIVIALSSSTILFLTIHE